MGKTYIVLVNFLGWKDTVECIESLLHLRNPDFQIVVCENNSPNNSFEYLHDWAKGKLQPEFETPEPLRSYVNPLTAKPLPVISYNREEAEKGGNIAGERKIEQEISGRKYPGYSCRYPIILIESGGNLGFSIGNNIGIGYGASKKDADYFWILNNDMICDPGSLDALIAAVEKDESIGAAGGRIYAYHDPEIIQCLGGTDALTWKSTGRCINEFIPDSSGFDTEFDIPGYVHGGCMFYKSEALLRSGMFDENYFMWTEDADLSLTTKNLGYRLIYCPGARIWHKEGGSTVSGKTLRVLGKDKPYQSVSRFVITVYYHLRNHLYFVRKFFPGKTFLYFLTRSLPFAVKKTAAVLFLYDFKWRRLKLVFRGLWDGVFRRMGKRIDPYEYGKIRENRSQ
jgi:GT2 family glycosyltransferase